MDHLHLQHHKQQQQPGRPVRRWVRDCCIVDWTCIFFIVGFGIAIACLQKTPAIQRPVFLSDATIAYPHAAKNSVAFWVAIVVPVLLLAFTAAVLEFGVLGRQQGTRQACLMLLNILLALLGSLAVTGFMTELFKRICGRLRPDFLARCEPAAPPTGSSTLDYGTSPSVTCTAPPSTSLADGHMSFPSGHASCSMVVGLFAAMYMLWAVHMRGSKDRLGAVALCSRNGGLCFSVWLRTELLRLGVMLLVLFELAWPWGVAVSRFRDNRHNVSDVVGGLLLGACFAPMFFARLVWHAEGWTQIEAQEASAGELQLQALSSGASNGAAHTARHTTVLPMADDMP